MLVTVKLDKDKRESLLATVVSIKIFLLKIATSTLKLKEKSKQIQKDS
jgi:hypothetical protein